MIIVLNDHLEIQPSELRQVTMCIRVFRSKDRTNLTHPFHVHCYGHLFEELGALRKVCFRIKVLDLEDSSTTFCCSSGQSRRVDPGEFVLVHELYEEVTDAALQLEDGLVGRRSSIKNPIVQSRSQAYKW